MELLKMKQSKNFTIHSYKRIFLRKINHVRFKKFMTEIVLQKIFLIKK